MTTLDLLKRGKFIDPARLDATCFGYAPNASLAGSLLIPDKDRPAGIRHKRWG